MTHRVLFNVFAALIVSAIASCKSSEPNPGSPEHLVEIPETELYSITGKTGFYEGRASGTIYNGTAWTIADIDIKLVKKTANETRRFRLNSVVKKKNEKWTVGDAIYLFENVPLAPYSTGEFEGSIGDFTEGVEKEDLSWTITSARGYKR